MRILSLLSSSRCDLRLSSETILISKMRTLLFKDFCKRNIYPRFWRDKRNRIYVADRQTDYNIYEEIL